MIICTITIKEQLHNKNNSNPEIETEMLQSESAADITTFLLSSKTTTSRALALLMSPGLWSLSLSSNMLMYHARDAVNVDAVMPVDAVNVDAVSLGINIEARVERKAAPSQGRAERRRDILDTDKTEDTDTSQKTLISSSHLGALPRVLWHRNHHRVRRMLLPPVALSIALSSIEQFNSRAVIIFFRHSLQYRLLLHL